MARSAKEKRTNRTAKRGMAPGTAIYTGPTSDRSIAIRMVHYNVDEVRRLDHFEQLVIDLAKDPSGVTWIDVDGIHDAQKVVAVLEPFGVHPLWIEDILNPASRPKAEALGSQVLVLLRMVREVDGGLAYEHVALVAGPGWVISLQERPGDVWDPIRGRVDSGSRIRKMDSSYLLHALLDAVVDEYFIALEHFDARIDAFEEAALERAPADLARKLYGVRNEIVHFRSATRPLREVAHELNRGDGEGIAVETQPFFRDLYDHVLQVLEATDSARDRVSAVLELHLALTSHQLNVVMRVLTVVSALFIPLTFIVGVYGMNFEHMPELHWPWAYGAVWGLMIGITTGLLALFWHRGWLSAS